MEINKGFVEEGGTKIYYESAGSGTSAIVFISGGGMLDRRMWDGQFLPFAATRRAVRYDLRGLGDSEVPHDRFSHVEDLRELLAHTGVDDRVALVGLSFGASIAIDFALEHPAAVEALILASPGVSGFEFSEEYMRGLSELFATAQEEGAARAIEVMMGDDSFAPSERRADARKAVQTILSDNEHVFRDFAFASFADPINPPAISRLADVNAPALVMVGDRDHPEHLSIAELLMAKLPRAEKDVIADSGHLVNMEQPEEFNRHSLGFLERL
jgi:pimeloyl-ACP methyl ester carboxylesterase